MYPYKYTYKYTYHAYIKYTCKYTTNFAATLVFNICCVTVKLLPLEQRKCKDSPHLGTQVFLGSLFKPVMIKKKVNSFFLLPP